MNSCCFEIDNKGKYHIIDEHDVEILDGIEINENATDIWSLSGSGSGSSTDIINDCVYVEDGDRERDHQGLNEVELVDTLEGSEKHDEREMREKCINSSNEIINDKKDKNYKTKYCVNINMKDIEVPINTFTVEEVIFKKQIVEIIHKRTRRRIMEGLVSSYTRVGQEYNPVIVLIFEDGRSFYNNNFDYLMRFYI